MREFSELARTRVVGSTEDGSWVSYEEVDFCNNALAVHEMSMTVGTTNNDRSIEVRAGSPTGEVLTALPVPDTGAFGNFTTITADLGRLTGSRDLFLVFAGSANLSSRQLDTHNDHDVAIAFSDAGIGLFVNGELVASITTFITGLHGNRGPLVLGPSQWASDAETTDDFVDAFNGTISNDAIYDVALGK